MPIKKQPIEEKGPPRRQLTDEGVMAQTPPGNGQLDIFDTRQPGLILRVNYGGRKTWLARYYRRGVRVVEKDGAEVRKKVSIPMLHVLGRYPTLKVKEARAAALKFLADPQKALTGVGSKDTFKEVAQDFLKRHVEANKLRTQADIERLLRTYVYPAWEDRPFREIRRGDVARLLDHIQDKHGPRQADMVLAIVRKLMNWHQSRNEDYVSPIVRGMKRTNGETRRKRILTDEEIRVLMKAAKEAGTFGAIVQVLLLTAQRREKVATMKWADIRDGVWMISTERREKANAGSLKLPLAVLALIEAQPRIMDNPYVFPGSRQGQRRRQLAKEGRPEKLEPPAFNSFSQRKKELEKKLPPMEQWTLHDLRRTAKSLMSRAGVRPDISERVLGHAIPGVEGVYDRYEYADEKADALAKLAALVERIVDPPQGNVVPIPKRARGRPRVAPGQR